MYFNKFGLEALCVFSIMVNTLWKKKENMIIWEIIEIYLPNTSEKQEAGLIKWNRAKKYKYFILISIKIS